MLNLAKPKALQYFNLMDSFGKLIAVDYGVKRVGLAICSLETQIVFPLCTLDRTVKKIFFENFSNIIAEHKPAALVLGLPLHEDGNPCVTTNQVKNFAASLARRYPLPIYFMEELLSSFEAEEKMRSLGVNAKKIKKHVDQEAAVLILESFLTAPRKNLYRPEQDFSKNK